jgi:hypothetical protein
MAALSTGVLTLLSWQCQPDSVLLPMGGDMKKLGQHFQSESHFAE